MKVALTGAHGTGKSTLSREAVARLKATYRVLYTPEVPRLFIEELGDPTRFRRENNTFNWQTLIVARQIEIEATLLCETDILICDRTIVDHWAYTEILFSAEIRTQEGLAWRSMAQRWARTYKAIVYLPIEFQVEDDGVREDDRVFQMEVDRVIQSLYREFGIPTITIRGTRASRLDAFTSIIMRLHASQ